MGDYDDDGHDNASEDDDHITLIVNIAREYAACENDEDREEIWEALEFEQESYCETAHRFFGAWAYDRITIMQDAVEEALGN